MPALQSSMPAVRAGSAARAASPGCRAPTREGVQQQHEGGMGKAVHPRLQQAQQQAGGEHQHSAAGAGQQDRAGRMAGQETSPTGWQSVQMGHPPGAGQPAGEAHRHSPRGERTQATRPLAAGAATSPCWTASGPCWSAWQPGCRPATTPGLELLGEGVEEVAPAEHGGRQAQLCA